MRIVSDDPFIKRAKRTLIEIYCFDMDDVVNDDAVATIIYTFLL